MLQDYMDSYDPNLGGVLGKRTIIIDTTALAVLVRAVCFEGKSTNSVK